MAPGQLVQGASALSVFVRVTAGEEALGDIWACDPVAVVEGDGAFDVGFASREVAERAAATLRWPCELVDVDEREGRDAWRAHAEPVRVGDVLIVPSWLPVVRAGAGKPDRARTTITIDPGEAFGTGSHPSTRLCVAALQELVRPGASVLDVGCGSGVLSIVAARLGGGRVVAVDVDPEAVRATRENAARNDVVVDVRHLLVDAVDGTFDVVVANIGAATITAMADHLRARVGAHLVLAGLLTGQVPDVVHALGLELVAVPTEDGWAAPRLRTRAGA